MELTDWIGPAILMASAALTVVCVVASFIRSIKTLGDTTESVESLLKLKNWPARKDGMK